MTTIISTQTPEKTRQSVAFLSAIFGEKQVRKFIIYSLNNTNGDHEQWCDWIDRVAMFTFEKQDATIEEVYRFHNDMVSKERVN